MQKFVFSELKAMMVKDGLDFYSPTGSVYSANGEVGYSLVIRRLSTALRNVYVNGKLLAPGSQYTITEDPDGLFTITLTKEFMQSLGDGEHLIKMTFEGAQDVDTAIIVKD